MSKQSTIGAYIELTKPRVLVLVLCTTTFGFYLGSSVGMNTSILIWLLLGVCAVCAGSSVLNHYLERNFDAQMRRTKDRPIPAGIISPASALSFGILLVLVGVLILLRNVNLLTAFLSLLTAFLYTIVYTPMKRLSWLNTTVGAIPGAIPPMGGWTAATGDIGGEAWILFAILFIWQHPHFYAIAWMFKEDYQKAGFKMLPLMDFTGRRTSFGILLSASILLPVSLLPSFMGATGAIYSIGTFFAGIALLSVSVVLARTKSRDAARNLLTASIIYLPTLFFLTAIDLYFNV